MLVTLPFVLLLLDWWPLGRLGSCTAKRLLGEKVPLLALAVASCVVTVVAQRGALASAAELPLTLRIGNATVSFVAYLRQFVWPAGLACFYPHPGDSLPAWKVAGALAVLLAITSAVILRWEKRRYLMVGWFWYTGMLVPVIGVAQVGGQSMADRYTYLPEIGLCAAIVWAAASVADARPSMRPMFSIAAGIVLGACAVAMWIQVGYWRDSETLWKRTIACTTPSFVPHYRLAIALAKQERFDEAIAEFEAALQFLPDAEAENNLGSALSRKERWEEAIAHYRTAIAYSPAYAEAHNNLGIALVQTGHLEGAIACFRRAVQLRPDWERSRGCLAMALRQRETDGRSAHGPTGSRPQVSKDDPRGS